MTKLSVIISAYHNTKVVVRHVEECMKSTHVPDEIIVVNDHGDPELKEALKKIDIKTKLIYAWIKEDIPWNYTGARNLGVWLSTGEYLCIEDQDHIPYRDYYSKGLELLDGDPTVDRVKTCKRHVVSEEDVLTKPMEEWTVMSSRPPHQDVAIIRRSTYLKVKGYDERLAGAYGWSATDWKRRLHRVGSVETNLDYQWVIYSEKTSGLSHRNYRIARTQTDYQSPRGILNFKYEYEQLSNQK